MTVQVSPIQEEDLGRVAQFLHEEFPHEPRESRSSWERSLRPPWRGAQPNWGFMALDGEKVVGAYVAHYSEQPIGGRLERFCNLGVWHVLPDYRMQSIPLVRAMVGQEGYSFTDLTPAPNVIAIDRRLGFEQLDTRAFLVPCLPYPTPPGGASVTSDPARLEAELGGAELERYRDHRGAGGLRHVAILDGERRCYVVLRPDRHGRLPVLSVLHVSDRELLRRNRGRFARHLLLRHRTAAYVAELRIVGSRPRLAFELPEPVTRMYRSERLGPDEIGYLYSELVCLP